MKVYGLTGGIASGKSTVARLLREQGLAVVDADGLAREVVEPGTPALREIAERFPGVVSSEGVLDRRALGQRVFSSPDERAALNAITHPRVRALALERFADLEREGRALAIYDVPLLIESQLHVGMAGVVLVWCTREQQLQRVQARDGLPLAEAEARVASQLPLDSKRAYARWLIDNSGTPEATRTQVTQLIRDLKKDSE